MDRLGYEMTKTKKTKRESQRERERGEREREKERNDKRINFTSFNLCLFTFHCLVISTQF